MIIAILFLMIAGGAIAYLGDWIGLTMGKRRLSVFGLRPRSTARLFTVAAGILIALFTFVILLVIDSGFRVALRNGTQLMRSNYRLKHQNRVLEGQVAAESFAARSAELSADAAVASRTQAVAELQSAAVRLTRADRADKAALVRLNATGNRLEASRRSLAIVSARLVRAHIASAVLQRNIAAKLSIIQQLGPSVARLTSKGIAVLQSTLLYRNGQEIGRTVIHSDQTIAAIRQEISAFLLRLSVQGQAAGLARGSNGRTVQVADVAVIHEGAPSGSGAKAVSMPTLHGEMDNISALADQIHAYDRGRGAVVLIARAFGNAFSDEQAIITLRPYGDHLVLAKGAQLAQLTIPVSEDGEGKVLTDLQELLEMARASAMQAGVIPVENPQLHQSDLGDIKLGDLFTVADEVRRVGGPAVVTASAARDTYSSDRLDLQFSVAPEPRYVSGTSSP